MQYLGLEDIGEIPSGYDTYVWMHERCLQGISWSKENEKKYSVIPRNWETDKEIRDANIYISEVEHIVLDYASTILNEYHHTTFTRKEWNILLNRWISCFSLSFYEKYLKLLKVESSGEYYECDLYDTVELVIAKDYLDYTILNSRDEFNLYEYSELYREHCHFDQIKVRQLKKYVKRPDQDRKKTLGYYGKIAYGIVIDGIKMLTRLQDEIIFEECYYLPLDLLFDVMKKRPGRITNYIHDYIRFDHNKISSEIDYDWRNKKETLPETKDEFVLLLCKLLKRSLPIAYVESFAYLQKRANKLYRFAKDPKAIFYSDNGIAFNEVFKVYLMAIRHKNVIFCDIQHGGNYGIERISYTQGEYELCDYFYTWGWRIEKGFPSICKPMPAAKLLNKKLQNVEMGEDILYVSYTPSKRGHILYKRYLFYEEEKKSEIEFLQGLSDSLRKKLLVRLFQDSYGWNIKEDIDRCVPGLRYDEEKEYYNSLKKVKLVILMLWSTTILEALYAGKPILVLHDICHIEDSALEDIKELERVGILVHTWRELSDRLEEIYQNIDGWWNEPERQEVVQKIRNKYMYMPHNAKQIWIDEILSLTESI